ncbi:MAG: HXXEE domain-containing protein [Ktedonobacterales bacterium]|nr:HXXEE domain-containing protein [Ktedonobacterales bacterium]
METNSRFWPWLLVNWSRSGVLIAAILGLLIPFFHAGMPLPTLLVFLHLPMYMVHQYEEHAHGAFKAYINREIGRGKEVLTDVAIFWINVGAVWLVDLGVIYLAAFVKPALGLMAIYLTIINGILHVVMALATRRYNPGLITSLLLFLPVGGFTLYLLGMATPLTWADHALGIGVALLIHLALVIPLLLGRRAAASAQ